MNFEQFYETSEDAVLEDLLEQVGMALADEDTSVLPRLMTQHPDYALNLLDMVLACHILEGPLSDEELAYTNSVLTPDYEEVMLRALINDVPPGSPLPIHGLTMRVAVSNITHDSLSERAQLLEEFY